MKNILSLLTILSLVGCGGGGEESEAVKPVVEPAVKPVVKPTVEPIEIATIFFNMDMYQNGEANIQYNMYQGSEANIENSAELPKYDLSIKVLNKKLASENKILHKLNFTDEQGAVHSENYVIDIQSKSIIKIDKSISYKDTTYKTFNYNNQYVQFDFNLEKGQEISTSFNVDTFDSALHKIVVVPTKVTTKYLGLDNIEVGNILYNTGKFLTIEETDSSIVVTATWFNITNGVIVKQTKTINYLDDNTVAENLINIVDDSIDFNTNYNENEFSKFRLNVIDNSSSGTGVINQNINLYKGANNPVVINLVNNKIKVSGYENHNPQFIPDSVTSNTLESHSDGVLSSFISKIQYARECEYNCSGAMINTLHVWGARDDFDSSKSYDSEYAGKYNWYRLRESMRPDNYFIVINLQARTCQVSTKYKLNIFECDSLGINTDTGEISAFLHEKLETGGREWYGVMTAYINGENNEFITGVVNNKSGSDNSIDTFLIKKRN